MGSIYTHTPVRTHPRESNREELEVLLKRQNIRNFQVLRESNNQFDAVFST